MRTIHDWLSSAETDEPFSHCIQCKLPLVEIAVPWLVNKEFHRGECTMEYAICQTCRDEVADGFSEESKESIRVFLEQEIDWAARVRDFMMMHDPAERFESCIACQTSRDETEGFGISALFDSGGNLVNGSLPLLVCRPCIGRMTASLSESSREKWRSFLQHHFDGPPDDDRPLGLF